MQGNVIVDEILASCYGNFHHNLAHLVMTPIQRFSKQMEWIFGDDLGYPVFVKTARELGMLLLPDNWYY